MTASEQPAIILFALNDDDDLDLIPELIAASWQVVIGSLPRLPQALRSLASPLVFFLRRSVYRYQRRPNRDGSW